MRKIDKHVHLGNNHHHNDNNNHNYNNNNKLSMSRSLAHVPHETNFMDQLTIAATQAGHRLNAYLLKLSTAFHRDLRSTCDTFELLMRHYDDEKSNCGGGGEWGIGNHPMTTNAGSSHTNKSSSSCPLPFPSSQSQSQRILENPQSLERLHEYLIVVRLLLIQTSASLLTTMDNIVIIKASADAYKKDNQKKKNLYPY